MKRAVFAVVLALWAQAGWSGFLSGNQLLEYCDVPDAPDGTLSEGICLGYIISAADTYGAWEHWGKINNYICAPAGITSSHLRQIVTKHLREHPEKLDLDAGGQVIKALREAFPCP
jgi:hypothetical protein